MASIWNPPKVPKVLTERRNLRKSPILLRRERPPLARHGTQEDKADTIMEIIRNLEEDFPEGVPMDSVRYSASEVGIDEDFVNEFVRKQKEEGALYSPSEGKVLTAVR